MNIDRDPITAFQDYLNKAQGKDPDFYNAMSLATSGKDGQPHVRIMLLKHADEKGFVFYTNLESNKGIELKENSKTSLCFFWKEIKIQVRIEGVVEIVTDKEADEYFATRPRESQIGAWASSQSRPLSGRQELEENVKIFEDKFEGKDVPRPHHWSGFCVVPSSIEFWEMKPARLHDRTVFTKENGTWKSGFLNP